MRAILWLALLAWPIAFATADQTGGQAQAERFYRAQADLHDCRLNRPIQHGDIPDLVDRVYRDEWVRKTFRNPRKPRVGFSEYRDKAYSTGNVIAFPPHGGSTVSVLHEISHQLTGNNGHGKVFAQTMMVLVHRFMGNEATDVLERGYRRHGSPDWIPGGKR